MQRKRRNCAKQVTNTVHRLTPGIVADNAFVVSVHARDAVPPEPIHTMVMAGCWQYATHSTSENTTKQCLWQPPLIQINIWRLGRKCRTIRGNPAPPHAHHDAGLTSEFRSYGDALPAARPDSPHVPVASHPRAADPAIGRTRHRRNPADISCHSLLHCHAIGCFSMCDFAMPPAVSRSVAQRQLCVNLRFRHSVRGRMLESKEGQAVGGSQ